MTNTNKPTNNPEKKNTFSFGKWESFYAMIFLYVVGLIVFFWWFSVIFK